jgi:hypothetical protein
VGSRDGRDILGKREITFGTGAVPDKIVVLIMRLALYGCETWFVTLKEGHRLQVNVKRSLRKVRGLCTREVNEVGEIWIYYEELHGLYPMPKATGTVRQCRPQQTRGPIAIHVAGP